MFSNQIILQTGQVFLQKAFQLMINNPPQETKKLNAKQCQIQYLKKYYDYESSVKKLDKLIQYYGNKSQYLRFTHPIINRLIRKNYLSSQQISNSQKSQSIHNFNFCTENLLNSEIFKSKDISCESISLLETLDSLSPKNKKSLKVQQKQKRFLKQYFEQSLNYVPFKQRKQHKQLSQCNQNIKKTLEFVQRQWQKHSKFHRKQGKTIKLIA